MQPYLKLKLFLFTLCLVFSSGAYSQINYGSNNGKYLTIRGTKIYYEEYGEGTPLLLFHGGFGNIADFQKCIPELSKKFRVIIPDSPGLGRSEFPDQALSYQLMSDYYSILIDQLKLDSAYIIGWSDGGITGLILAHDRPDKIKRLLASGANYKSSGINQEVWDGALQTVFNPDWIQANWKDWIGNYKRLSPHGDWKRYVSEAPKMWLAKEYFPISELQSISIPVLVVMGDNDMVTFDHTIEIKSAIKNSQLCILPNTSHEVFNEKPELIDKIATDFFAGK
ncbi:MAG: alpha/beta hydrolase [Chitinophagales bacterium]